MQHRVAPRSAQSRKVHHETGPSRSGRSANEFTRDAKDSGIKRLPNPHSEYSELRRRMGQSAALLVPAPHLTNGPISPHLSFGVAVSYRADQPADSVDG